MTGEFWLLSMMGCGLRGWEPDPDYIGDGTFPAAQARAMQDVLNAAIDEQTLVGVQAALIDHDGYWTSRAGTSDWQRNRALEADDQLRIASISKAVTATLVMQAVEEGRITLNDVVAPWVPDVPGAENITVRQLLAHEAGTLDVLALSSLLMTSTMSPRTEWDPTELLRRVQKRDPAFSPGEDWGYSNTNYLVLAMLLEEVHGVPYAEILAEGITFPLGLTATVAPPGDTAPRLISGYDRDFIPLPGRTVVRPDHTSWATASLGSGSLVSTALELATLGDALMTGALVNADTLKTMLDFREIDEESMPRWTGVGLGVFRGDHEGRELWGHEGQFIGFSGTLAYDPELSVTVAVLSNTSMADPFTIAGDLLVALESVR